MQIIKIMNNSLVLAIDHLGNECILMGKGLGYKKAIGNKIIDSDVEKIFLLKDKSILKNFVQLANEIDDIYFNLVKEIVEYGNRQFNIEVMDYLYLSLSDHISFTVKRYREGAIGENFNYIEVIKFHKEEFEIGKYAVSLINNTFKIDLPISEASAIGLHFVNAKLNSKSIKRESDIFNLVKSIETIVSHTLNIILDHESFAYSRFITHLNYFSERLVDGVLFVDETSNLLYDSMKSNMKEEDKAIEKISQFIQSKYKVQITQQEKVYLMVHLHRIFSENKQI